MVHPFYVIKHSSSNISFQLVFEATKSGFSLGTSRQQIPQTRPKVIGTFKCFFNNRVDDLELKDRQQSSLYDLQFMGYLKNY